MKKVIEAAWIGLILLPSIASSQGKTQQQNGLPNPATWACPRLDRKDNQICQQVNRQAGVPITPACSEGIKKVIELIEKAQKKCALDPIPCKGGGSGELPGTRLRELWLAGRLCSETNPKANQMADGWTSPSPGTYPTPAGNGALIETGDGTTVHPRLLPKKGEPDYTADMGHLAFTLLHELWHDKNGKSSPTPAPGDEKQADQFAITQMCKMVGCAALGLTPAEKDSFCYNIKTANERLCMKYCCDPIPCPTCDSTKYPSPSGPCNKKTTPPKSSYKPICSEVEEGYMVLNAPVGVMTVTVANPVTGGMTGSIDFGVVIPGFVPLDMSGTGTNGQLIVSGYDLASNEGMLVMVYYDSSGLYGACTAYRGTAFDYPEAVAVVGSTQTAIVLDTCQDAVIYVYLSTGTNGVLATAADDPRIALTDHLTSWGRTTEILTILTEGPPHRHLWGFAANPGAAVVLLHDLDGDFVIDYIE